jgi:diguanylate cyclase (GGDEF)-like protein/putative nucleotidyltransferase with HDIG domain
LLLEIAPLEYALIRGGGLHGRLGEASCGSPTDGTRMSLAHHVRRLDSRLTSRRLHSWLPVVSALVLAVIAGWSVMALNGSSYRAKQDRASVPTIEAGVAESETLLLTSAKKRLAETGAAALAPVAGAPPRMAVYYKATFKSLSLLGHSTSESAATAAVSRAVLAMTVTQDGIYRGGAAALVSSRRAPAVIAALKAAFASLVQRLSDRARFRSRLASGGTMLIMLVAALSLVVLLRRFDRMRSRLTDELHVQAMHDPLTGLANRRQLTADLARAMRGARPDLPARLVVFDLDGFKAYNDAFGHHGGDLLLTRLARALAVASAPHGTSYRLGGDEFCTLFSHGADDQVVRRCLAALSEIGEGFAIVSSHGSVQLPNDAHDPDLAMQLADERMYSEKNSGRESAGQQTRNIALKVLSVQQPDVEHHSEHVAELVASVAHQLGMSDVDRAEVVRAAELHDIGKIAIPYAVLHKQGPLDENEWEMMRRHAVIGANILAAAPALADVAEIVRHHHERFDGGGYPQGLEGTEIPLGSRIVFVCDSYDAMVSERPHSRAMSQEGALDELRRNAGTQFDPLVVDAFCAALRVTTPLPAPTPASDGSRAAQRAGSARSPAPRSETFPRSG